MDNTTKPPRKPSGFALLTPEQRRVLASKAGRSVPGHKRAFARDRQLASEAGRKGRSMQQQEPKQ